MPTFLNSLRKAVWIQFIMGALFCLPLPLRAQNTYIVNDAAGDTSPGSLAAAVSQLNFSSSSGAITFNASSLITLAQPLGTVSQAVTFQGSSVEVDGQNDAQSQFLFQQAFTQQVTNLTLTNNGGAGAGLDLAVTAASWSMDPNDNLYLNVLDAPLTQATSGIGVAGQAGGNVQFVVGGTWTMGNICQILGGAGGAVTDSNGTGDQGGSGGSVTLNLDNLNYSGNFLGFDGGDGGALTDANGIGDRAGNGGSVVVQGTNFLAGDDVQLKGGSGGAATDLGTGTPQGGDGGSVVLSLSNSLSVSLGALTLQGGGGGAGVTGGNGGGATLVAESVTLSSNINVEGGNGGGGASLSGMGGNASVSIGLLNQSSNYLKVTGGAGGNSSFSTGAGGNVQMLGGTVTLSGTAGLQVLGGEGGNSALSGSGGDGGSAGISLGSLSLVGSGANFNVSGGIGGLGSSGAFAGNGGDGGNLAVTMGTLGLNTGSALTLTGGAGGSGGNGNTGVDGGNGGAGGTVSFVGSQEVSLGSGTTFLIAGAAGGTGGTGDLSGLAGTVGQAYATIGMLEGQGTITMNGSSSLLQVDSGNFSGILGGNETLQKTDSGALTLSGANSYSGGTTVSSGQLVMDTGGVLGTGAVANNAQLIYIDSATAGNANITTGTGGALYFENSASGGTARLILNGTGYMDISQESAGRPVTIGSLEGSGNVSLGGNDLAEGSNNLSTFFSGTVADGGALNLTGGSLTKIGTGTLTLSGTNSYTGGTNLDSGVLAFGSAYALGLGSVSVNGGTLQSAGFPLGLVIGGNYNQGAGGTLKIGLGGALIGYLDTLNVTRNVSLNGTLNLYSYGGLTPSPLGDLTVMLSSSGTLTGTFQQVEENLGNGTRLLPLYFNNGVELESIVPSFSALSITPNEKVIGADLDKTVFDPKLMVMMSQLGTLSGASFQAAADEISPEGLSALFQAGFEGAASHAALVDQRLSQFRAAQQARFSQPGYSQSATPLFAGLQPVEQEASMGLSKGEGDWSGFVSGNGGILDVNSNDNAAGYKMTSYGLAGAGADVRLSSDFALGLMAGFNQSNITLDGGGTLTAGGGQLGLYGLFASHGFYADGLVEGGINNYTTLRQSYVGEASGQTQGQEWSGALEFGYGWEVKPMTLGPVASLQYTRVGFNGFSETGSVSPLTYPTQSQDSLQSRLGFQAEGKWKLGTTELNPEITIAWEHEYDNLGGNVEAGFGTGDSFAVAGPSLGKDGVLVGAGINLAFSKDFSASLNYRGELARTNLNSQQFGGGVRLGF